MTARTGCSLIVHFDPFQVILDHGDAVGAQTAAGGVADVPVNDHDQGQRRGIARGRPCHVEFGASRESGAHPASKSRQDVRTGLPPRRRGCRGRCPTTSMDFSPPSVVR